MLSLMAQVGGVALLYPEENRGLIPYFTGIDKLRFRHPVHPGDTVRMRADIVKVKGTMGKVSACSYVGDTLCAQGEYLFALMPEIWQDDVTPANVAAKVLPVLTDPAYRQRQQQDMQAVHQAMGERGANIRIAQTILDFAKEKCHP